LWYSSIANASNQDAANDDKVVPLSKTCHQMVHIEYGFVMGEPQIRRS